MLLEQQFGISWVQAPRGNAPYALNASSAEAEMRTVCRANSNFIAALIKPNLAIPQMKTNELILTSSSGGREGQQNQILWWVLGNCRTRSQAGMGHWDLRIGKFLFPLQPQSPDCSFLPSHIHCLTFGYPLHSHFLRLKTLCALGKLLTDTTPPSPCSNCCSHPKEAAHIQTPALFSCRERVLFLLQNWETSWDSKERSRTALKSWVCSCWFCWGPKDGWRYLLEEVKEKERLIR